MKVYFMKCSSEDKYYLLPIIYILHLGYPQYEGIEIGIGFLLWELGIIFKTKKRVKK